jgi:hypothetical protein
MQIEPQAINVYNLQFYHTGKLFLLLKWTRRSQVKANKYFPFICK